MYPCGRRAFAARRLLACFCISAGLAGCCPPLAPRSQPPFQAPRPARLAPPPAAPCTCGPAAGAVNATRVLQRFPLDYYTRPCRAAQYSPAKSGTLAKCEKFTVSGKRFLSDCMAEGVADAYLA